MASFKYYKGTKQECEAYINGVDTSENYGESTKTWDIPIERNGSWYVTKHDKYTSAMELVDKLPQTETDLI